MQHANSAEDAISQWKVALGAAVHGAGEVRSALEWAASFFEHEPTSSTSLAQVDMIKSSPHVM